MRSRFCRRAPCGGSQLMGQLALLLIGSRALWVAFKIPRGPAFYGSSARDGSSAPGEGLAKERGSPDCSTRDQVHLSDELGCRTAGCERGPYAMADCHAPPEGKKSLCCGYSEDRCRKKMASDLNACAGSEVALKESRLRGSQASLNSDCQKNRRKQFSLSTTPHVACSVVINAFQQYERLVNLATAKLERR